MTAQIQPSAIGAKELSRNSIEKICSNDEKLKDTFVMQVIDVKTFDQTSGKAKINAKYKLSDGVSIIHAMLLQQISAKMRGTIPKNGVIEFLGYVKNKINGKNLIIF